MKRERVIELWLAGFVLVAGLIVVVVLLGTAAADGPPMSERADLSFSPIHNLLPTDNVYAFGHLGVVGNITKKKKVDPHCNEQDGCYPYGDGCEERDYYRMGKETGCNYTSSNRHTDGWMDTGNTRWVDVNECEEKEQKEQEYRDYKCSAGCCHYSINDTKWIDTGIYNTTCNYVSLVPPEITSFAPLSYADDTVCNWRTFDVTVNQAVNVSWYLNNTLVLTNESVLKAKCTLHAKVAGEHNVTAIASNANGSDMQTWIWDVTELQKECEGTDTSCGIYPNCGNCNEQDGCYPYGDGCEERDYYCMGKAAGCNYTSSNRHNDSWVDTGNTRWIDENECQEKEQKEQEYRDYECSAGSCHYSINDTKWIDTGNRSIKANGTICGCTANNTVKRCYDGNCTDTGIGNSSNCCADVAGDGKGPNCTCGDICVITTGWWRDGGAFNPSNTPIQHAIDNAISGETICVRDGTYNENVDVNVNNLIIKSENGSANCIVNASNPGDYVFEVTVNYVNISGFTIEGATGAGGYYYAGIYLGDNIHNCMISHNTIVNNNYGIWLHKSNHNNMLTNNNVSTNTGTGIALARSCTNNMLTNNIASGNQRGIRLADLSNYNTLTNNMAGSNAGGISLSESHYNTLTNNTANSNTGGNGGILLTNSNDNVLERNTCLTNTHGIKLDKSNRNTLEQNNCSSNYNGFVIKSSRNNALRKNTANLNGQHGIFMYRAWAVDPMSNFNTLINNSVSNNTKDGIHLNDAQYNNLTGNAVNGNNIDGISLGVRGSHNNLTGNTVTGNSRDGIRMESAHYNNLTRNTVNANSGRGIYMRGPSNNNMIYNNYFNNTNNAYDEGDNTWNITKEAGTNIIGGPYLGGNYWSDYAGIDTNGDGLGDTLLPYNSDGDITTGGDWHPLVPAGFAPPEIISFAPPSPVNDTVCNWRTFNVTVNQRVNVSWYLNGTLQATNVSVTEANCTLHAKIIGEHNVSVVATNANGTDMQTWIWNVSKAVGDPDLVITGKWLCWPDNCTICYNVTNTGTGTAPASHNATLYVDDVAVAHDHVPVDLAPGESYIGCFNGYVWTYTPPSDNITVCADNSETIVELNETNNCLTNIWICGDVTGDGRVRTSDGRRIFRHLTFGDPIGNMWAADVTGDGRVRTSDGRRIFRHLTFGDPLNCNCSG